MSALERLIFQPQRGGSPGPVELGVRAEDAWFDAEDGVRLHAYWLPDPAASRSVLFFHGNAGHAGHRLPFAERVRQLGASVLLVDYRGYGRSEGSPSEPGLWMDGRAALGWLEARGVAAERTVLFGRSLGGAVAVDLAQDRSVAGVILESTFTNTADIARSYLGVGLDFWLASHLASDRKIARLRAPLLMFHGDRDRVIRLRLGRRLFDAAPEPKEWVPIPGGRHNDTWVVAGPGYFDHWKKFLDQVAP